MEQGDPEEKLMDVIASSVGFLPALLPKSVRGKLSFEGIIEIKNEFRPNASARKGKENRRFRTRSIDSINLRFLPLTNLFLFQFRDSRLVSCVTWCHETIPPPPMFGIALSRSLSGIVNRATLPDATESSGVCHRWGRASGFYAGRRMRARWLRGQIELKELMVAKACNVSNLLLTGFRLEIVRPAA